MRVEAVGRDRPLLLEHDLPALLHREEQAVLVRLLQRRPGGPTTPLASARVACAVVRACGGVCVCCMRAVVRAVGERTSCG